MEMNLPAYVGSLIRLLEENGYECYVVGGAVRSFLLHMPVHDYDLTTDAVPEENEGQAAAADGRCKLVAFRLQLAVGHAFAGFVQQGGAVRKGRQVPDPVHSTTTP